MAKAGYISDQTCPINPTHGKVLGYNDNYMYCPHHDHDMNHTQNKWRMQEWEDIKNGVKKVDMSTALICQNDPLHGTIYKVIKGGYIKCEKCPQDGSIRNAWSVREILNLDTTTPQPTPKPIEPPKPAEPTNKPIAIPWERS